MKHAIIELYEDKFGDIRGMYICKDTTQQDLIYTDPQLIPNIVLFDTEEEAVEWGNQNIAPTARGSNMFRAVSVDEKEIFKMRLEG